MEYCGCVQSCSSCKCVTLWWNIVGSAGLSNPSDELITCVLVCVHLHTSHEKLIRSFIGVREPLHQSWQTDQMLYWCDQALTPVMTNWSDVVVVWPGLNTSHDKLMNCCADMHMPQYLSYITLIMIMICVFVCDEMSVSLCLYKHARLLQDWVLYIIYYYYYNQKMCWVCAGVDTWVVAYQSKDACGVCRCWYLSYVIPVKGCVWCVHVLIPELCHTSQRMCVACACVDTWVMSYQSKDACGMCMCWYLSFVKPVKGCVWCVQASVLLQRRAAIDDLVGVGGSPAGVSHWEGGVPCSSQTAPPGVAGWQVSSRTAQQSGWTVFGLIIMDLSLIHISEPTRPP